MTLTLMLNQTTVSGTATQRLLVRIPDGNRAGGPAVNHAFLRRDSGNPFVESVYASTFKNYEWIQLFRPNTGVHQLSTNQTCVFMTVTFDVCAEDPGGCP